LIRDAVVSLFSRSRKDRPVKPAALQRVLAREAALVEEFEKRSPHIPLVQHRTGEDDSALGTARFADLEARPRRLIVPDHPAVTYVELAYRYAGEDDSVFEANLGRTRLYARIEDPLCLNKRRYSVEAVRVRDRLREPYFRQVFALMNAQSLCNRALGEWWQDFFLPDAGGSDRDLLATIQNFNHNIVTNGRHPRAGREHFVATMQDLDFDAACPDEGPMSLRMAVRPHRQDDDTSTQSVTSVLVGTARGIAFRRPDGKVEFLPPGNAFEKRFAKWVASSSAERLDGLSRPSWRRNAEERIWGGPGECEAYFHNHDRFVMKGLEWTLERDAEEAPRVMGTHRNVAAYRSGQHRVAVKAVPFESVGDLVRLTQAHQYVLGVQAPALLAQASAHPALAREILTSATSLLSAPDNAPLDEPNQAQAALGRDWSSLFKRKLGPMLHQVSIDYEQKLLLAVLDWSEAGMLSDFEARKRLLQDCSLSHRLRLAANLFRNGHQLLEDDVTHTDLKPENILNLPGPAYRALQKARRKGWDTLSDAELEQLNEGEPALEGDFSGIHFGRQGAIDNLSRGEGLPTSIHYSSWKFTSLGLSEGTQPMVLRKTGGELPRIDTLLLEQDIANRGTTAWEIVYGTLVDCIPPAEEARRLEARRIAQERVARNLEAVIQAKREKREDSDAMQDLESAMQQCDGRLLDVVSLRSETIDAKSRITPLFQEARDNQHGLPVWIDSRVIDLLDHLTCDFRRHETRRHQVAKLYRTAEAMLRAEATRLERADRKVAGNRRKKMVAYLQARSLHFNPDSGLLGLPDLPRQLVRMRRLVAELPDPRRALAEFTQTWHNARQWGASVLDALDHLQIALEDVPICAGDKGRDELEQLVQSAVRQEHASLSHDESRIDEPQVRPPHLGMFEGRCLQVYGVEDDRLLLGYTVED
jgi:hypothetical protein